MPRQYFEFLCKSDTVKSRIKDTDYAFTMAELAKSNIVRQAGIAMLAQVTHNHKRLQLLQ